MKIRLCLLMVGLVGLLGCGGGGGIPIGAWTIPTADATPPGGVRTKITMDELSDGSFFPPGQIHNGFFLPVGEHGPALHELNATLTVRAELFGRSNPGGDRQNMFPSFSVDFFTHDGFLVPTNRRIIPRGPDSYWTLLLSPGRVWSETTDNGWSRASFPFVLGDEYGNAAHNGVATFAYNDRGNTRMWVQITQESAAWDIFDAWTQVDLNVQRTNANQYETQRRSFIQERADRFPTRPLSELGLTSNQRTALSAGIRDSQITYMGIVRDGILYQDDFQTRFGPFPYPEYMRSGAFSVSKSIGASLSAMYLAQHVDADVLQERVGDWLTISAGHNGWDNVTLGHCLDMRAGIGDLEPTRSPNSVFADENRARMERWSGALTETDKLNVCWSYGNYPWGPGEVTRYNSTHTFVFAAALAQWTKARVAGAPDLWPYIQENLFKAIGIHHMPMMHTVEANGRLGVPYMAVGTYPTTDDLAKISELLQNGGKHGEQQLLHPDMVQEALFRTGGDNHETGTLFAGLPQRYRHGFWTFPQETQAGCAVETIYMSGYGGNIVMLAPNGLTAIRFSDSNNHSLSGMHRVLDELRPLACD